MSIRKILHNSIEILKNSDSSSPELDAKVLICHALNYDTTELYQNIDKELTLEQEKDIKKLIKRRKKGEPVAYITKHKEFYGLDFFVDKNVLIPRPETEFLVEYSIKYLEESIKYESKILNTKYKILDLGTGSGCIIISIIKSLTPCLAGRQALPSTLNPIFFASDISLRALKIAQKNYNSIINHQTIKPSNHLNFIKSDLLSNPKLPDKFDLIIANLPYVPSNSTIKPSSNPISFESATAIFAEDNGTEIIKRFLKQSVDRINPNGLILIELDPRNAKEIKTFAQKLFFNLSANFNPKFNANFNTKIELKKDLSLMDRYLIIKF